MNISPQARSPTWIIRQDLAGPYLASLSGFLQHTNGPDDNLAARVSSNGPWTYTLPLQTPFTSFFPTPTEYHFSPSWTMWFGDDLAGVEAHQPVEDTNSPMDDLETRSNPEEEVGPGQHSSDPWDEHDSLLSISSTDRCRSKAQRMQHSV